MSSYRDVSYANHMQIYKQLHELAKDSEIAILTARQQFVEQSNVFGNLFLASYEPTEGMRSGELRIVMAKRRNPCNEIALTPWGPCSFPTPHTLRHKPAIYAGKNVSYSEMERQ